MGKVTLSEIARRAGISTPSVSMILNKKPYAVTTETRERVFRIARELDYQPNYFARSLRSRRTDIIGISGIWKNFTGLFSQPYLLEVFDGIRGHLNRHNKKIVFQEFGQEDIFDQSFKLAKSKMIDGVIFVLFSGEIKNFMEEQVRQFKEAKIAFVLIHSLQEPLAFPNIGLDCVQGGFMATEHLIQHGYRTIGCVKIPSQHKHSENLFTGYQAALRNYNVPFDSSFVYECESLTIQQGYQIGRAILDKKGDRPCSLFVTDDLLAYGMIKKFNEKGIRVPQDIALISFGDYANPYHELLSTKLTTIRQPGREKGEKAAEVLLSILEHPDNMEIELAKIFTPSLTIRESCGCSTQSQF
jgi:LacI family transcriptional regulator